MQKNDVIRVDVDGFGADAEGVCRHGGRVVFVPGALPGETIDALIVKVMKGYAYGRLLAVHEESRDRTAPPCPYYPRCGGCSCQHMTYEASLAFKRRQTADCLERIGGIRIDVPAVAGMDHPWRYRNKTVMPLASVNGSAAAGFYMKRSHRLVPVDDCLISKEASSAAVQAVLRWMDAEQVTPYDETSHTGTVRHVMTRVNHRDEVMVLLTVNTAGVPVPGSLISSLREAVPGLVSVCAAVNRQRNNVILPNRYDTLWGAPRLEDTLCGLRYLLSPLSFFQINREMAQVLYSHILDLAAPGPNDRVFDLYSGAGTISLLLAQRAAYVYGVESSPQATEDARHNAQLNGLDNVSFIADTAENALPRLIREGVKPDIIVLDPPRKGAGVTVIDAIAAALPERVVYVSCNPATQARDAARLVSHGYRVTACQGTDMFCQTADIENVLLFER